MGMEDGKIFNLGHARGLLLHAPDELMDTFWGRAYWFNEGHNAYGGRGYATDDGMPEHGRCSPRETRWFRAGFFAADAGFPAMEVFNAENQPLRPGYDDPSDLKRVDNEDA